MHYICTICSKDKRKDLELLPAIERYSSSRIKNCYRKSINQGYKLLIFSGEYGFLYPHNLIPFYDHLLKKEEIDCLLPILKKQNKFLNITSIDCVMEPIKTFGWEPYYEILGKFAVMENIDICFKIEKR